jgi:tRNA(adenine34) deaminase
MHDDREKKEAQNEQALGQRGQDRLSTFPAEKLFTQDAETVARAMASKQVSPKGIGSGIRMVQYFVNRAGKSLPAYRRRELEKAKRILQEKAERQKHRRASAAR